MRGRKFRLQVNIMVTLEADIELLEEYLDGALDDAAVVKLRDRLASDAPLSVSLVELQSQRALRQAVFQSMEPGEIASRQLMWRVRGAMLDQQRNTVVQPQRQWNRWGSQWRIARIGSAAAACVILGFSLGRLGHGRGITSVGVTTPTPISSGIAPGNATPTSIAENHPSPGFVQVGNTPRISIPITDNYGNVVAWQTFDNAEQAKNFTEDLHHSRGDASSPASSGQIKQVDSIQPSPQVPF